MWATGNLLQMMSDQPLDTLAGAVGARTAILNKPCAGHGLLVGLRFDDWHVHRGCSVNLFGAMIGRWQQTLKVPNTGNPFSL
jgi:hypothetical protein